MSVVFPEQMPEDMRKSIIKLAEEAKIKAGREAYQDMDYTAAQADVAALIAYNQTIQDQVEQYLEWCSDQFWLSNTYDGT